MNIRTDFPVCLRIQAEDTTEPFRDELLLVLLDHEVHSIHEVDGSGLCQVASFDESAWEVIPDEEYRWIHEGRIVEPVDRDRWRSFPDLGELRTAAAGKQAIEKFGPLRVSCDLLAEYSHGSRSIDGSYDRVQVGRIIVSPPWQFPEIIHPRHS